MNPQVRPDTVSLVADLLRLERELAASRARERAADAANRELLALLAESEAELGRWIAAATECSRGRTTR